MFLFEGKFGNVLHTGDCRLTPECLQCFPEKFISKKGRDPRCQLDYAFLDCTFGRFHQKFPSKNSASQQVLSRLPSPHAFLCCVSCFHTWGSFAWPTTDVHISRLLYSRPFILINLSKHLHLDICLCTCSPSIMGIWSSFK